MSHIDSIPSAAPCLSALALVALLATSAHGGEVFSKPPSASGGLNSSSWVDPDGSDSDWYAWDDFTLAGTHTISEVRWRGGYALGAPYGHATDFRVSFFSSIAGGFQPLIVALPDHEDQEITIATFHTNSNAGETPVGVFGGIAMYDYHFVLPTPVTLTGGVKYWFRVVASQTIYPDWGVTTGTGGDGSHFRFSTGLSMFQNAPHDLAFSLHEAGSPPVADFTATPTRGPGPLTVTFANASSGTVTSHLWDFGDGGSSTQASPTHTYARTGSYTVTLTESGPGGVGALTRTECVVVTRYARRR